MHLCIYSIHILPDGMHAAGNENNACSREGQSCEHIWTVYALVRARCIRQTARVQALEQVATLRHAAGDEWSEHVPETDIVALLTVCGRAERPLDLAVLLRELDRRGRRLAGAVLPSTTDAAGRSVSALTSWLSARVGTSGDVSGSMLEGGAG